jgi:hypothetical protein
MLYIKQCTRKGREKRVAYVTGARVIDSSPGDEKENVALAGMRGTKNTD